MRYYVNFGTGAGDEWVDGTLEDAKKSGRERPCIYTDRRKDTTGIMINI